MSHFELLINVFTTLMLMHFNSCKVRKEYNYARFFSILRSPSTPYLFACIMFKYVYVMCDVNILKYEIVIIIQRSGTYLTSDTMNLFRFDNTII